MHQSRYNLTIAANGETFSYNDVGYSSVPIIFIHGFPFDKFMWHLQIDFLKTKHRVIAYDIRGFGKSTNDSPAFSMDLFADDLVAFMNALQIEKAIICSLSMGGYIALNVVSRFAERLSGIILCDTQCIADSTEGKEKRYKTIEQIEANGLNDFAEGFVKNVFTENTLSNKKEVVKNIEQTILSTSPKTVTQTLAALAQRNDTCATLAAIAIPTLIICGSDDKLTPLIQSEFLHKNILNSTLQIIPNAAHLSNLEQADTFNKALEIFLQGFR